MGAAGSKRTPEEARHGAYRVAVTGGFGAGKSTFCRILAALPGVRHLEADAVAHEILKQEAVCGELRARFGGAIFDAGGGVVRSRLAARAFADPEARRELEAILHPRIQAALAAAVEHLQQADGVAIVLVEIPLLAEVGGADRFDEVITVEAPAGVRRRRLVESGWDRAQIEQRFAAQASSAARRAMADRVVVNAGDRAALEREAQRCWKAWRRAKE